MTWYSWILLFLVLTFGGYLYNRIVFWIGAFINYLIDQVIYLDQYWFSKGTTLKDLYNTIKYHDGIPPSPGFEKYAYYTDSYEIVSLVQWIAGINILIATGWFCLIIVLLTFILLVSIIRFIVWLCTYLLYPYFIKYIVRFFLYIFSLFIKFCKLIHLNNFIKMIKTAYHNTIFKLQNLRIA